MFNIITALSRVHDILSASVAHSILSTWNRPQQINQISNVTIQWANNENGQTNKIKVTTNLFPPIEPVRNPNLIPGYLTPPAERPEAVDIRLNIYIHFNPAITIDTFQRHGFQLLNADNLLGENTLTFHFGP